MSKSDIKVKNDKKKKKRCNFKGCKKKLSLVDLERKCKCEKINLLSLFLKLIFFYDNYTHNNFFAIVVGEENDTILENYISFSDFNSDKTDLIYETLYKCIVNKILLQNPEEYIINNLTNITKNKSLAEMIFKSYDKKDEYIINIEEIESIILFKSSKLKLEYREYFKSLYINDKIYFYDKNKENYYLNFEGFNKFLLNLNEIYLSTFKIKESINDLYYKITKELIDSYNQLFRNFSF